MNRGRGKRGPASLADMQAWEALIRDPSPPLMPPYGMEKQARDEFGVRYIPTCDEDRNELQRLSWPWSTACIWVAWQTFGGAADGVAAFRHWRGMIWREGREGDPDVRPGRLMPLDAAERALRNALEADTIQASAVHGDGVMPIPAGEWPRLAWERAEHGEVIEFDRLLMLGAARYEGVTLPRAAVMRLWPALDGWMPDGAAGTVEDGPEADVDPIDVLFREMPEETSAPDVTLLAGPASEVESTDLDTVILQGAEARAARSKNAQGRVAYMRERVPDLSKPGAAAALRRHSDEYQKLHRKKPVGDTQHGKDTRALRAMQK